MKHAAASPAVLPLAIAGGAAGDQAPQELRGPLAADDSNSLASQATLEPAEGPPEQPTNVWFGLLILVLLFLCACSGVAVLAYRNRDNLSEKISSVPLSRFLLYIASLAVGASALVIGEGCNPDNFMAGMATPIEMRVYLGLACLGVAGFAFAILIWVDQVATSDKVERLRSDLAQSTEVADKAKLDLTFANSVNRLFLSVVSQKTERLESSREELEMMPPHGPAFTKKLQQVYSPLDQCLALLGATWSVLELHLRTLTQEEFSLRVALFRIVGNRLEVELSTDGTRQSVVRAQTRSGCATKFEITNGNPASLAIQAALSQDIVIEPDTSVPRGELRTRYRVFDDCHDRKIKSIAGIPLGLSGQPDQPCRRLLCIDTNVRNGFSTEHLARLEQIRDNLEQRLLIELVQRDAFSDPPKKKRRPAKTGQNPPEAPPSIDDVTHGN